MPLSVRPEEDWDTYAYDGPEGRVVVSFHTRIDQTRREAWPYCARVILPLPGGDLKKAYALEDEVVARLDAAQAPCIMLGTLTHSGSRELVFQVADWERFRPPVGGWITGHKELELDVSEHDGWEFFDKHVWPSDEMQLNIADRKTIDSCVRNGSDPAKPHALEYVFLGKDASLAKVKTELLARGYTPYSGKVSKGQLIMVKKLPLELDEIFPESKQNAEAAKRHSVVCDGWGTAIVR